MLTLRNTCCLCLVLLLGCEAADLIMNPMVDRWCGERPCGWDVEGKIKRVSTWHTHDFAVELISDDAVLSQVNHAVDADDSECYGFSMIADLDERARVFLELDFLNDGSVEFSQRLPAGSWQRRTFLIRTPSWYQGVRFIVRKDGPGHVVLAELRARPDQDCSGKRVVLRDRPSGVPCEHDDECQQGRCAHGSCSFCSDHSECPDDQICGVVGLRGQLVEKCTKPGRGKLASPCSWSEECAAGVCCEGVCSQCCPGTQACAEGLACERGPFANTPQLERIAFPFQCDPAAGRYPSGAVCTVPQDCQSNQCAGNQLGCDDLGCDDLEADGGTEGTRCDAWCPRWALTPGTCN